ncbi:hypothetical protein N7475_008376 [Penicillium sp. IBT 31633x]|nr:hypothetical protein N7475_008376 [Penicillium sp. IBT 31633x]
MIGINDFILYKGIEYNEVDQYLRERIREYKREFLVLSRLTHNLLSVLATSAGVERLFNSARDIYYYRRGSLYKATI